MATPTRRKVRAKRDVKNAVRKVDVNSAVDILAEAVALAEKKAEDAPRVRTPGATVEGSKIPFTEKDLIDIHGLYTFIPDDTRPITIQGVRVQLLKGYEITTAKCFYNYYQQCKREEDAAAYSLPKDTGFETLINVGGGALEPE